MAGTPGCRRGGGRVLWELVPPGSLPSRPLREGEAFPKGNSAARWGNDRDGRRRELCPCGAFKSREQCPGAA